MRKEEDEEEDTIENGGTLLRTLSSINYVALPLSHEKLLGEELREIVAKYVRGVCTFKCTTYYTLRKTLTSWFFSLFLYRYNSLSASGQETVLEGALGDSCRGFIRVQLNLRRPINVLSGMEPPKIYNVSNTCSTIGTNNTLTSFYLPPETFRALHVTSDTTTRDVIRNLLAKFRVADSPHKYALYEKRYRPVMDEKTMTTTTTLSRVRMRKLKDLERPLVLALLWVKDGSIEDRCFVLQENDPGDVSWESFSVPELKNFLLILDREEAWYKKRIHEKYETIHAHMEDLIEEKRAEDLGSLL